jgi:hypothetical protein
MANLQWLIQQAKSENERSVALRNQTLALMIERDSVCQQFEIMQEITADALAGSFRILRNFPPNSNLR